MSKWLVCLLLACNKPSDTSSDTSNSDSSNPDDTSVVVPEGDWLEGISGSRLKQVAFDAADGSFAPNGAWYDSELNTECYFNRYVDGQFYCVPAQQASISGYYADENCELPLGASSGCGKPLYAAIQTCTEDGLGVEVSRVNSEHFGDTWTISGGNCVSVGVGGLRVWNLDLPLEGSDLVKANKGLY